MSKKTILVMTLCVLLFVLIGCGENTKIKNNEQTNFEIIKENTNLISVSENDINDIIPILHSVSLYMYENNVLYDIQDKECYWGVLQRAFSIYDIGKRKGDEIIVSDDVVKKYADIMYDFNEAPSANGLSYINVDKNYEFKIYDNSTKCVVSYINEDDIGNLVITIRLYDKNNELLNEVDYELEKYEDGDVKFSIKMLEHYQTGSRMVIGNIKEFLDNEIVIDSYGRDFILKYDNNILKGDLEKNEVGDLVMLETKEDVILEIHAISELIQPIDFPIILK